MRVLWRGAPYYLLLRWLSGACLLLAALLKGYELAYVGLNPDSMVQMRGLAVAQVICEFLGGAWLLTGLYPRITRMVAALAFFGFFEISVFQALQGNESCGCFGGLKVNPWVAACLDLIIALALVLVPPQRPYATIRSSPLAFSILLLCCFTLCIPGTLCMTEYHRLTKAFTSLRLDKALNRKVEPPVTGWELADAIKSVEDSTHLVLTVDPNLNDKLGQYRLDAQNLKSKSIRCWTVLEAISRNLTVPARWNKTDKGYVLLEDSPLKRTKYIWLTCSLCGLGSVAGIYGGIRYWDKRREPAGPSVF